MNFDVESFLHSSLSCVKKNLNPTMLRFLNFLSSDCRSSYTSHTGGIRGRNNKKNVKDDASQSCYQGRIRSLGVYKTKIKIAKLCISI